MPILDAHGRPIISQPKSRHELADALPARLRAGFDAARDTDEFKNYWANADALDADSAHSKSVRDKLIRRSRYEVANNGYADGMVQTHANFLVGRGPSLQMKTRSRAFNEMVETTWRAWGRAVRLRRKLWCLAHAKVQDGEAFAIIRENRGVRHDVQLDLVLIEAEQCTTPFLPFGAPGRIDGIEFDAWGNPVLYDILPQHPGGAWGYSYTFAKPERVAARWVLHWFHLRRPGQHRAIPEFCSTLNCGAAARRWREATIAAAETAAEFSALLKTTLIPDSEADPVAPMSAMEFQKRMVVALPMGWEAQQMKGEHPST
ncbi:MAG: phage portal protein, partial [Planctomycetaceae bacterium]